MARTFGGTSADKIALPIVGTTVSRTAFTWSIWFKTTNAGSSRLTLYSEGSTLGTTTMHISANDGAAGRITVARRDESSNLVSMAWDGGLNDGNWHLVTYIARAKNDHELVVDGVSRATSSVNLAGTFATVEGQSYGYRRHAAADASYFNGTIADLIQHGIALTVAEALTLYNKTKHAFNCSASGQSAVRCYWPFHNVGNETRNVVDIRLDDTLPTVTGTTVVDGPSGVGPTGMTESTDPSCIYILGPATTTLIAGGSNTTDGDYLMREPGNVVHDTTDSTHPYKMYYACTPNTYAANDPAIRMAYTTDLTGSWTKYGEVIPNSVYPLEDPYVVITSDGTYHMWAENKTSKDNHLGITHLTSTDKGITWSVQAVTALDKGSSGAWDDQDVSSPIVWLEGASSWYMLFEGRQAGGQNGALGLATASSPNGPWTKNGGNPVATARGAGFWDDTSMVCDDLVKIGSTYYLYFHANNTVPVYNCGMAYSTNLTAWTWPAKSQMVGKALTTTLMRMGGTQFGQFLGIMEAGPPGRDFKLFRGFGDAATQTQEWPAAYGASGQSQVESVTATATQDATKVSSGTKSVFESVTAADVESAKATWAPRGVEVAAALDAPTAIVLHPVRPIADVSAGGWVPSTGPTLYETIDEAVVNDTDCCQSPLSPAGQTMEVLIAPPTQVPAVLTDHVLSYRLRGNGGAAGATVALYCGTTLVASWVHAGITTVTQFNQTLTTQQAALLAANYNDARVRVTAS